MGNVVWLRTARTARLDATPAGRLDCPLGRGVAAAQSAGRARGAQPGLSSRSGMGRMLAQQPQGQSGAAGRAGRRRSRSVAADACHLVTQPHGKATFQHDFGREPE